MGSFGCGNMEQFDFDPSQGKLVPKYTSEQLYKNGVELEFDSSKSKLVPKTKHENDFLNAAKGYKNGENKTGSFGCGNMEQFDFDPSQGKLVPKYTSEQLYKNGVALEFDSSKSKLVPKTKHEKDFLNCTKGEQAYKNGTVFDFDPSSSRLVPKEANVNEIEQQMRCPSSDKCYRFDKTKKCIKIEDKKPSQSDRQVKVDMNRRGLGGFF